MEEIDISDETDLYNYCPICGEFWTKHSNLKCIITLIRIQPTAYRRNIGHLKYCISESLNSFFKFEKFHLPIHGNYYDLITVPHGHIPSSKIFLVWKIFPIPISKKLRDFDTFSCPVCGERSFFKIIMWCRNCDQELIGERYTKEKEKYKERKSNHQHKQKLKIIENIFLPIFIIIGKAKYMRTDVSCLSDYQKMTHFRLWGNK